MQFNKLVCATCDVHFLDPQDEVYRRIIMAGQGFKDSDDQAPLYLRTTEEMLEEFSYLGDRAYEVVVENSNKISDQVEHFKPVPDRDQLYSPTIRCQGKSGIPQLCQGPRMVRAQAAKIVEDRLKQELSSIIGNGFSVLYTSPICW